ncbi:MAG: hypothetical protein QOG64_2701, partial [Acidimicrobiaceae bacterium]|nr:hypothetical protein [Acidimicrobiaceae bacterium]
GVRHAADEEAEAILAAARATRSDAADEAHRLRETASQEAAEVRAAAAQEAERLVEASLARRDRLAQEALELQRRLTTAQETLDTLLGIVSDVQIGPEPTDSNGSSDAVGGSDEGQGGEDAYAGASSDEYHGE